MADIKLPMKSEEIAGAAPRVAVVTPVFNNLGRTLRFLDSIRDIDYPNYDLIIVDDGSSDGTSETIRRLYPDVVLIGGDGNLWWSGGTNAGVRYALANGHEFVLTINNDTIVRQDFLTRLVSTAMAFPRSIVGARNNYLDEPERVHTVGAYPDWNHINPMQIHCYRLMERDILHLPNPFPVETLTGCGTLIPTKCFREIGLYDERYCPQYHGDSELVMRAVRRGYRAYVELNSVIWNDTQNTSTSASYFSKRSYMYWRPHLAIRLRYAPRRRLVPILFHFLWPAAKSVKAAAIARLRRQIGRFLRGRFVPR